MHFALGRPSANACALLSVRHAVGGMKMFKMCGNHCRTDGKLIGRVAYDVLGTWARNETRAKEQYFAHFLALRRNFRSQGSTPEYRRDGYSVLQERSNKFWKDESCSMHLFSVVTSVGHLANRCSDVPT